MTIFEIFSGLSRNRLKKHDGDYTLSFTEDNLRFIFHTHSTGEGIDIYLLSGDKKLHVYYDYNWFSDRYLFNEEGKKHGYLLDGPWNKVIARKLEEFAVLIAERENQIKLAKEQKELQDKQNEEQLIEHFRKQYA